MKKLALVLVLLMVFGLVQTFAQDAPAVKLSGAVYVWQNYESPQDFYAGRYRFRLNFAYTDGSYGVRARYQVTNGEFIGAKEMNVPYAYGYVGILDGMIKVTAGKGVPFVYGAWSALTENILYAGPFGVGVVDNIVFGGFNGASLTVTPMSGLEIGVGLPVPLTADPVPTLTDFVDTLKFGVKFALPDLLTVYGYFDLGMSYAATVTIDAVENLTAAVKFESDSTDMGIGAALSYELADLGLTISNDFAMVFGGDIVDDFAVTYAQDAWDVMVGFAYNDPMYVFLYFNAYVGKYTFNPYVTVNFDGDFAVTLMHTFAF